MIVNNLSKDQMAYELVKKGLDVGALRSKLISNNISNVNTKGYKKFYVTFEDSLKEAINGEELKLTNNKHISLSGEPGEIKVVRDESTSTRTDGNNVNIDLEMVNEAANAMMYNALVSQANSKISMERYVINEGRR